MPKNDAVAYKKVMLYLIVCSHQILLSGRLLTAYKSIQKIKFHQKKNLMKTQVCHQPSISKHKKLPNISRVHSDRRITTTRWMSMHAHTMPQQQEWMSAYALLIMRSDG